MGLNNIGVDYLAHRLEISHRNCVAGASFTKNTSTHRDHEIDDYVACMSRLYGLADYLVADVSCPNTTDFESNANLAFLDEPCATLKSHQRKLHIKHRRYTPLLLKLSCDWDALFLHNLSNILIKYAIDGVICGNTSGGVSGRPLFPKALNLVRTMRELVADKIPIIACGGIFSNQDITATRQAGAQLFKIYTSLVYRGPGVVSELLNITDAPHEHPGI